MSCILVAIRCHYIVSYSIFNFFKIHIFALAGTKDFAIGSPSGTFSRTPFLLIVIVKLRTSVEWVALPFATMGEQAICKYAE